jgi:hypothetical protein
MGGFEGQGVVGVDGGIDAVRDCWEELVQLLKRRYMEAYDHCSA